MTRSDLVARCALGILIIALSGCANQNDHAPAFSDNGQHSATWITDHRAAYQADPTQCAVCHGTDLQGGIAQVDCFNQGNLPSCHFGGHGPRRVGHPLPFSAGTVHGPVAKQNLVLCQGCHAQPGGAGSNPRFNIRIGALTAGCEGAGCHNLVNPAFPARSSAHPRPWLSHNSSGNQANACALCHGANFGGRAAGGVGPACNSCHTALSLGSLPVFGSCNSCHLFPPTSGSHLGHLEVASITCPACHKGGGTGAPNHGNGTIVVSFDLGYNAKSGAAQISADHTTCSNVICHGGIVTPVWGVGSIEVDTQCTSCHTDATATPTALPQFNSFFSGKHHLHIVEQGLACTDCHDMNVTLGGNGHFTALNTPAFELPAAVTLRSYVHYIPAGPSCQPEGTVPSGNTVTGCHTDLRFWINP